MRILLLGSFVSTVALIGCANTPPTPTSLGLEQIAQQQAEYENRLPTACANVAKDSESPDKDAVPLVRTVPTFPPMANNSGHCNYRFNVNTKGQPVEIETLSCTQSMFERPSNWSLRNWKYNPKMVAGQAVDRCGVETKISFKLHNDKGELLPE